MKDSINKVVLAYSGGLDTSVLVKWLMDKYDCEVVCYSADLGQGEDMQAIKKKALQTGASEAHIFDLKEEFVKDYVFPMFRANAIYEGYYLLGTSIARPLIAKHQVELAEKVGADSLCHGCTGKGNDQIRFELAYMALNPKLKIIAPWRIWDLNSRTALMDYAKDKGIDVPTTHAKPYSCDGNLLHISYEGGVLEDPWVSSEKDMFRWGVSPQDAPDETTEIEIEFKAGDPVAINGETLSPANLLTKLNDIGAKNGVGRIDIVENRFVGMKSRGVYETPGGTILYHARRALESITLDREVLALREDLMPRYARLVYNGFWFSPERETLQKTFDATQEVVNGTVKLHIYKGNVIVIGRRSQDSLYHDGLATFEEDDVYNQADAEGFIKLQALRLKLQKLKS